jgi:hypothetical protein
MLIVSAVFVEDEAGIKATIGPKREIMGESKKNKFQPMRTRQSIVSTAPSRMRLFNTSICIRTQCSISESRALQMLHSSLFPPLSPSLPTSYPFNYSTFRHNLIYNARLLSLP